MKLVKILANKKFLFSLVILDLAIILFWKLNFHKESHLPFLIIRNQKIYLETADTPAKISQGLSDRQSLPQDQGMLFIFDKSAIRPFWMNRMKFNLDFVFIKDSQVVDLAQNIPFPKNNESPQIIIAKELFDRVLEVNSGTIKRLGIKKGDQISL